MCGILGILSRSNQQLSDQQIIEMRDTMTARGPDDAGLFRRGSVSLAHRRLAIRDLSAGRQPWVSQNGRYVVVYNGEIYNDDQLRSELNAAGIQLKTRCDTEVLVESWALWGPGCIEKLRGMFAFSVVDLRTEELWLVRDRCGVKPLFFAEIGRDFVFASSIAAIRRHPGFSSAPNFAAVGHYLQTLRLTLDRQTVFENIYTVRPAELIHVSGNSRSSQTWWSLPTESNHVDYQESQHQLQNTITESVKLRLKSDVPVGMMISGGVDSSTLVSLARQQLPGSVNGCCGGGKLSSHGRKTAPAGSLEQSDFHFAKQCASDMEIDYAEVGLNSDDYRSTWKTLIDEYETPVSTPTDAIINQVASQLRQTSGVALGGEGADEAFCGYAIAHWSGNDFDRSNALGKLDPETALQVSHRLSQQYGQARFSNQADHYLATHSLIGAPTQQNLFHDSIWQDVHADNATGRYYDQLFTQQPVATSSQRIARVLFQENLKSLLGRLDSATMAAGLEARVPFTDHVLVEQAFRMPTHFKIDLCPHESKPWLSAMELDARGSLHSKRILRSVAANLMSQKLADRPKQSFPTPIRSWLAGDWRSWANQTLLESPFANQIFRREALVELTQLPANLALWNWPVLNIAMWGDRCFS